jgi:hypothetical protein
MYNNYDIILREQHEKDHVRAECVHVCMTAHGRVSAEEALLFCPGQIGRPCIRDIVKMNSTCSGSTQSI